MDLNRFVCLFVCFSFENREVIRPGSGGPKAHKCHHGGEKLEKKLKAQQDGP